MNEQLFSGREMKGRLACIRAWMARGAFDALFVEAAANVRYASGFRGEPATLWITPEDAWLLTSFRNGRWAEEQSPTFDVHAEENPVEHIAKALRSRRLRIGVDWDISSRRRSALCAAWPDQTLEPARGIEMIRWTKSEEEIARLRRSQMLNERIFQRFLAHVRPGITERAAQGLILGAMAAEEAIEGPAFPPIVAAGANAWEIHHQPDHTVLASGDLLIVDLGVKVAGYASDMTRAVCLGRATGRMKDVHAKVCEAQAAGLAKMAPGVVAREVEVASREVIDRAGFGRGYTHGFGHGIGIEVHDAGLRMSPATGDWTLLAGMTLTAEPGIYIEHEFGVRLEDMVVVRSGGVEPLTTMAHDILEVAD